MFNEKKKKKKPVAFHEYEAKNCRTQGAYEWHSFVVENAVSKVEESCLAGEFT